MDDGTAIIDGAAAGLSPAVTCPCDWRRSAGVVAYPEAVGVMAERVAAIRDGRAGEAVWLLEHPPIFTAGTSAQEADLFNPMGFPIYPSGRGGQWTYHGPGQRVVYVMLDLRASHGPLPPRDVRMFVHALEGWLIDALADLGIIAGRREGRVGVWVTDADTGREAKIAALGVRMTRWVSWHGVSLNIDPILGHFDGIVPCGIREHGVTSLRALGSAATMAEVDAALAASWPCRFGGHAPVIQPLGHDRITFSPAMVRPLS